MFFLLDSFMMLISMVLFLVGVVVFTFTLPLLSSDKSIMLLFGYGFLLTSLSLFVYAGLLFTNLFIQV